MLKFFLLVNKQGHTRVSQYYEYLELEEKTNMEAEITRKCLIRNDNQVFNKLILKLMSCQVFILIGFIATFLIHKAKSTDQK